MLPSLLLGSDGLKKGLLVSSKGAIAIDALSGKVLYAVDPDTARSPASTTKIMTALLCLERLTPDSPIVAGPETQEIEESSMHLKLGESMSVRDMLYGLLLRSGNDSAVAIAVAVSGSVKAFAKLMNDRARQLGCTNTSFQNPNGLNDPTHLTSPHDLALITREAMKYPLFRQIVRTRKFQVARSINIQDLWMVNKNKLLKLDASNEGVKTGYTKEAGHCFVGSAFRDGFRVITVVLDTDHWIEDTQALMSYAFLNYEPRKLFSKGDGIASVPVNGGKAVAVSLGPTGDVSQLVRKGDGVPKLNYELPPSLDAPIHAGQRIGFLVTTDSDGYSRKVPLIALADVDIRARTWLERIGYGMLGGAFMIGLIGMRRKARRLVLRMR